VHVGPPWSAAPNLPKVGIVPGGGWPGTLKPEVAPNVLFFGDGFPEAARNSFEQVTNSFVHFMKSDSMVRPFDLLATSINFWRTFVAAPFGISVRSEVWIRTEDAKTVAKPVPIPSAAVGDEKWELPNMLYAVGLPVAADAAKPDATLKAEWATLVDPDPAPKLTASLIKRWKNLATRTFIDEVDGFPGMSYGVVPAINQDFGNMLDLHDDRGGVAALKLLYPLLQSDSGVALDGAQPIGNVWATTDPRWHFDNTDLVVLVSSIPGGRALNGSGFIAISTSNGNIDLPVTGLAGRFTLDPLPIPTTASADSCHTMTHELGHSFGLGDEYEDLRQRKQNQDEAYEDSANLTTEKHAQDVNGNFSGDEVRWNWHRIRKAGLIEGAITEPSPGVFKIPLRVGDGLQFAKGDKLLLRLRERHTALPKHPTVLAIAKQLEIGIAPTADSIIAVAATAGATTLPDLAGFAPGSIVYVPTPAPGSAAATTPYAEMIALNVKNEISAHNRPLTSVPCANKINHDVQVPDLKNISIRGCFSHKTRIVGLYEGGNRFACGVFHPTGECMMRHSHEESAQFCAVCRYIVVDFVNPFLHFQIDRDYAEIYPQPD
jgi:IgA Peptidase M64